MAIHGEEVGYYGDKRARLISHRGDVVAIQVKLKKERAAIVSPPCGSQAHHEVHLGAIAMRRLATQQVCGPHAPPPSKDHCADRHTQVVHKGLNIAVTVESIPAHDDGALPRS